MFTVGCNSANLSTLRAVHLPQSFFLTSCFVFEPSFKLFLDNLLLCLLCICCYQRPLKEPTFDWNSGVITDFFHISGANYAVLGILCLYYTYYNRHNYPFTTPSIPVLYRLCLYYASYTCAMPTMPVLYVCS